MDITNSPNREDKLKQIDQLQASFHHKGELLLPDEELYPKSFDPESFERAGKKICVWLGVKPHHLKFSIDDKSAPGYHKDNIDTISIDSRLAGNPFAASAVLAIACIEYFLVRKKIETSDELTELTSVEFGLGLLIINSFNSSKSLRDKTKRVFGLTKNPSCPGGVLTYFSPIECARLVEDYINKNQLSYRSVAEHILPWALSYLNIRDQNIRVMRPADYSQYAQKNLSTTRVKILLLLVLVAITSLTAGFLLINQPKKLPPGLQIQKEAIETLEKSYKACLDSARYKQQKYDDNDLFMTRQLDAHISRCTSIRNSHDYQVRIYNEELEEAGLE